jgi:hypothetical protein
MLARGAAVASGDPIGIMTDLHGAACTCRRQQKRRDQGIAAFWLAEIFLGQGWFNSRAA